MPWLISLLLNRYAAAALAVAALATWGWLEHRQAKHWEQKYEDFRIEAAAAGEVAKARTAAVVESQERAARDAKAAAKRDRDRIVAHYEQLRDTGRGVLPTVTVNPSVVDVAAIERLAGGKDFERACALDADQVIQLQNWINKVGIPVSLP